MATFVIRKENKYLIYSEQYNEASVSPDTWTTDITKATKFSKEFESLINLGETYERIEDNGKA